MKTTKTILDFIGFTALAILIISLILMSYASIHELPKTDNFVIMTLDLLLIGLTVGFIWSFSIIVWLYIDDKQYKSKY